MRPLTIEEVLKATQGMSDRPQAIGNVTRVAIDSREVRSGDLFVAIRGERFDGHDYVGRALAGGAVAALVRNDFHGLEPDEAGRAGGVLIRVDDPVTAMGRLALYCRRTVMEGSVTVVAVTGSNGKTTTKSMIAHILSGRWTGRASIKSFNNNIGVPLTLLSVEPSEEFVICEVGTNAPGEIAALGKLVEPEIAVITGVSECHLEGLGSLEGIAREKLSLLGSLRKDGCAILNADHEIIREALRKDRALKGVRQVTFGAWPEADLRLTGSRVLSSVEAGDAAPAGGLEFTVNDRFRYRLSVPGRHNISNAMAAIAVARRFGMDHDEIAGRLASFTLPPMRLQSERVGLLTLINDAYNANPASMAAGLGVLCEAPALGRRVLIMGDMRELGPDSERLHREIAERIGVSSVDVVVAVGERGRLVAGVVKQTSVGSIETHASARTELACRRIGEWLQPSDTVLVKGSRALGLERVVEAIRAWAGKSTSADLPGSRPQAAPRRRKVQT